MDRVMEIKRTGSVQIRFGDTVGAEDLRQFVAAIPNGAEVKVHQSRGDNRDAPMTTVTATWDLGRAEPRPGGGGFIYTNPLDTTLLAGAVEA